jgi:hypothetical protein
MPEGEAERRESWALLLDDDMLPSLTHVLALLEWTEDQEWTAGAFDYLPRNYDAEWSSTVSPNPVGPGLYLVGAGCLLIRGDALVDLAMMPQKGGRLPSQAEMRWNGFAQINQWMADDYSICANLGGVTVFPGIRALHMSAGAPESAEGVQRLKAAGYGQPRLRRTDPA